MRKVRWYLFNLMLLVACNHIQADNVAGLALDRDVAREAGKWYQKHIGEEV